jgi:thioredoxin reductase (NADPH)
MADQDLHAAAFPRLDKAQLAALQGCPLSKLEHHRDGEKLFEAGQCDCNVYVVKTGAVEILDDAGDEPTVVATLGHGEFTGEVAQLTGGPAIFSGVARARATSSRFRTMPCVRF